MPKKAKKPAKSQKTAKSRVLSKTGSQKTTKLSFDTTVLIKKLIAEVPERAREVLVYRFGLGTSAERETLEAIGERWGITRERVRQIEAAGIDAIRKSKAFTEASPAFDELAAHIKSLGGIVPEVLLLEGLASDEKT